MILVDSNVLIDWLTHDPVWYEWSVNALDHCFHKSQPCINPVIYAEVSCAYRRIEDLNEVIPPDRFKRLPLPYEAAFLAGKCFVKYRRQGGQKRSPLPDFYIGAHAAIRKLTLLTRDAARYRHYFPNLKLISPSTH